MSEKAKEILVYEKCEKKKKRTGHRYLTLRDNIDSPFKCFFLNHVSWFRIHVSGMVILVQEKTTPLLSHTKRQTVVYLRGCVIKSNRKQSEDEALDRKIV